MESNTTKHSKKPEQHTKNERTFKFNFHYNIIMEVLRSILEGKLSKEQRERANATMKARYPPYSVELNRLNNADRYINQQVFDMEKAQAEAYNVSQMPPTLNEKGKLFKIQSYANPFVASLRGKIQLYEQTTTLINFLDQQTKMGKLVSAGDKYLVPESLKNNYFGTKEVLSEYNALMTYMRSYASDLLLDNQIFDKIFQGIMTPILQQLDQVITSYGSFWNVVPNFNNRPQEAIRNEIKKAVRRCWIVYNTMYDNISNLSFEPLTDAHFSNYEESQGRNVDAEIFNNKRRAPPAPIPLPPQAITPQVPAPQQLPPPVAPVPQISSIKDVDQAIIARFQPPPNITNTSGQTISSKDYFYLVGFKWTEREDEFLSQTLRRFQDAITREKGEKKQFETRLADIQQRGQRRAVEGELLQRISDLDNSIKANETQFKETTARRVKLLNMYELLAEYLREVAKLPTDSEGNFDTEVRKIRPEDMRLIATNEDALKASLGLTGFGFSGGQMRILPITDDHRDHIPIHTSEFEMKRRMSDRARGDPRIVEPDQNIPTRMRFFPEESEFNPAWELLKRGFKANDTVMEPDRTMADVMPIEGGRYEASGIPDDENATAFKQRFGLPFSQHARRTDDRPIVAEHRMPFGGFFDIDDNDEFNTIKNMEGLFKPVEHFKVEEEPDDILNHPDEFKRKIESYRFNTGRMKNKPSFMK